MDAYKVPEQTRIGHVHLKVADLQRSLDFYCGLLGFDLTTTYGTREICDSSLRDSIDFKLQGNFFATTV